MSLGAIATVGVLVGCSALSSNYPQDPAFYSARPHGAGPSGSPVAPTLNPSGLAADNQAYFDAVNQATIRANGQATGSDFGAALVKAGFARPAIQMTSDVTAINLPVDAVEWAVKMPDGCLVGQYGPRSGGYHSVIASVLSTGSCFVSPARSFG